ncbi:MAG: hypothetical protein WCO56_18975 [Verrucomicrobiota bacterium]
MNTSIPKIQSDSLQPGQVWKMADCNLEIGKVGKLLVHYKHYRGKVKRVQTSLTTKREMCKYLLDHKAVKVAA